MLRPYVEAVARDANAHWHWDKVPAEKGVAKMHLR
jgi:hypothetical protein